MTERKSEKYIPEMTLKNLQDFAIANMDEYRKFMQGRKRLKRKKNTNDTFIF